MKDFAAGKTEFYQQQNLHFGTLGAILRSAIREA